MYNQRRGNPIAPIPLEISIQIQCGSKQAITSAHRKPHGFAKRQAITAKERNDTSIGSCTRRNSEVRFASRRALIA
jgi:hypothetical protein